MKKSILIAAACLSALLLIIFLTCFYLLATESGAAFLVTQAQKQLGESLTIGAVRGKVLDRLELDTVHFTSPATGSIKLDRFVLDWKSSELLKLKLHILELSTSGLSYTASTQKQEETPPATTPFVLPELTLPLSIVIDKLEIQGFSFLSAPETLPLLVNSCKLRLSWGESGIVIQQMQVETVQGTLSILGSLDPRGSYPLDLTSNLSTHHPEIPSITLQGKYSGDLNTLQIKESLRGDLEADLQISLQDILGDLNWLLDLEIQQLKPALFIPDLPGIVEGKLSGKGSLHTATATGVLQIRSPEDTVFNWDAAFDLSSNLDALSFHIKNLSLEDPQSSTRLKLSGTASLDNELDLDMHWTDLQWPLTGPADYASSRGTITLKGTVEDYHLQLSNCSFSGEMLPRGQLSLTTDGNRSAATNLNLTAQLLNGETSLQGNIQWSPDLKWQLTSRAQEINPGEKYEQWPGSLQWNLTSSGSLHKQELSTELEIVSLEGILRELPLAGSGRISMEKEVISIDAFSLSSAGSTIEADGQLSDSSSLQWKLDVYDIADLLPKAKGKLHAGGTLQGAMQSPRIEMQLLASDILFQELALKKLSTDVSLDLSWQDPFSISLEGTRLQYGPNLVSTLQLQGAGTREEHALTFTAEHELATLSLDLKGGYLQEQWQGFLDQLSIRSKDMGSWDQEKPADVKLAADAAALQELCLARDNSTLCLSGSWEAQNNSSSGDISISSIPMQWLSPWLPDPVEELDGFFSATANVAMEESLQAEIHAGITPGDITYTTEQQSNTLPHQGMKLDLLITEDALDASLFLGIDSNVIKASFSSPDILPVLSSDDAEISGSIRVDAKKFDLVEVLVPAVQSLDAAIDIDLGISGTLNEPKIEGTGNITIPYVFIPPAGLELTNTIFDLQSSNTELKLKGKLNSPGGSLNLNGYVTLDRSQNFPLQLTLNSDNFRLLNLPEMRVFLSSDLLLERTRDLTTLSGELTVPRAEVLLRELPKGSQSPSPDVVIIQETEEEESTSPVKMDIKVTLGKDVHFAGLGLNAFINGQLSILSEPGEQLLGSGSFSIEQGSFRAYGQDLDIETGIISFPGGPLTQPGINLRATRTIGNVVAGISAIGPAKKPRITTFSDPPMSEGYVISYLLTGSAPNDVSKGTKVSLGRQINNKLSVSMGTDVKTGDSEFITRYRLNRSIHVQTTTAGTGNAVDIFYSVELGGKDTEEIQDTDLSSDQQK